MGKQVFWSLSFSWKKKGCLALAQPGLLFGVTLTIGLYSVVFTGYKLKNIQILHSWWHGFVPAKSSFGMPTTNISRPLFAWHNSRIDYILLHKNSVQTLNGSIPCYLFQVNIVWGITNYLGLFVTNSKWCFQPANVLFFTFPRHSFYIRVSLAGFKVFRKYPNLALATDFCQHLSATTQLSLGTTSLFIWLNFGNQLNPLNSQWAKKLTWHCHAPMPSIKYFNTFQITSKLAGSVCK